MAPVARLRIALLVDSPAQPRWIAEAFARVARSGFAEVTAIVHCPGAAGARDPLLWRAYARLDSRAFGLRPDPMEPVDLRGAVPHRAFIRCDAPSALPVDVTFTLGAARSGAAWSTRPRLGVWRYCFGERADESDALAGAEALLRGAAVARCGIRACLEPGARERTLCESWSRVFGHSLARTRDNQLLKAQAFAERTLRTLRDSGEAWLRSCALAAPAPGAPDPSGLPSLLAARSLGAAKRRFTEVSQWFLAYRFSPASTAHVIDEDWDIARCRWLVPPKDRFWADPFPIERGGRHYVFFEELEFGLGRARISMIELARDGSASTPVPVLERPYHLSYPFLFEHAGALFMIPETGDNRCVEVYRCRRFPDEWTLEKVLLEDGFFTDATLHRAPDRWWMFVNLSPDGTQACDELHLYHAADPLGAWKPHRLNPVKSDVRGARPAGRLYQSGGALYRPGQIGTPIYGHGVSINRVLRLTPTEYVETETKRVLPAGEGGVLCVHTVNRAGDLAVMDGFLRRPRFGSRQPVPALQGYAHGL
jgi:hypothetical protein